MNCRLEYLPDLFLWFRFNRHCHGWQYCWKSVYRRTLRFWFDIDVTIGTCKKKSGTCIFVILQDTSRLFLQLRLITLFSFDMSFCVKTSNDDCLSFVSLQLNAPRGTLTHPAKFTTASRAEIVIALRINSPVATESARHRTTTLYWTLRNYRGVISSPTTVATHASLWKTWVWVTRRRWRRSVTGSGPSRESWGHWTTSLVWCSGAKHGRLAASMPRSPSIKDQVRSGICFNFMSYLRDSFLKMYFMPQFYILLEKWKYLAVFTSCLKDNFHVF